MRSTLTRSLFLAALACLAAAPMVTEPPSTPPAAPPSTPATPTTPPASRPAAPPSRPARPAQPAPSTGKGSVANLVLKDLEGKDVKFADLLGSGETAKPMIIEMWATWCAPCRTQRQTVHSVAAELSKHVHVIAVSVDDTPAKVKAWLAKNPSMAGEHIADVMVSPEFRTELRKVDRGNTIPKVLYVNSKGEILEVTGGGQSADWLLARAKSLK